MRRHIRQAEPRVTPPGAPSLRDVVNVIDQKTTRLCDLDTAISKNITTIERRLREMGVERILSVRLPDGCDLGWSRDRRRRKDQWRFVIRDEDAATELLSCSREERVEVFTCGAMAMLLAQAGLKELT